MKQYTLMLEDTPVIEFDFEEMTTHVWHSELLPFYLRGSLVEADMRNVAEYYKAQAKNILLLKEYCASRVLSLSRENAKQIYAACGISQNNSIENRVAICLHCKGVSVNDSYWFKTAGSADTWESVNVRTNHLAEIVDVALGGKNPTLTTSDNCPELTTKGLFRKAWTRQNNDLYLLKSDRLSDNSNTRAELLVSQILDCTDIPHVQYTESQYDDMLVAKCKNFVAQGTSFVEAHELILYCKDTGLDYTQTMLDRFGKDFANIAVIDYLIQNTDRHDENYGFIMDNTTGYLVSVAPLFDHNQALIADWLGKDVSDTLSQMLPGTRTILSTALRMAKYSDIKWDMEKWSTLVRLLPEQKVVFDNIERRVKSIQQYKEG